MTLEQVKAMTDEELRIRVAELLGWTNICEESHYSYDDMEHCDVLCGVSKTGCKDEVPNYPRDLNACHKMEETLTDIQFCKYVQILCGHTTTGIKIQWGGPDAGRACRATARQRCEAFIIAKEEVQ